jgi:hypothetical protein
MNHSLNDCIRCAAADEEMRWLAARSEFRLIASISLTSKRCRVPAQGYHPWACSNACVWALSSLLNGGNAGYHTLRAFIADVSASHQTVSAALRVGTDEIQIQLTKSVASSYLSDRLGDIYYLYQPHLRAFICYKSKNDQGILVLAQLADFSPVHIYIYIYIYYNPYNLSHHVFTQSLLASRLLAPKKFILEPPLVGSESCMVGL